jgi:Tol biopolymer transport system component
MLIAVPSMLLVVRAFGDAGPPRAPGDSSPSLELDPRVTANIEVGPRGQTNAILAAAGSVWVTAYSVDIGDGTFRDFVYRLDPATDRVEASIELEGVGGWVTGGEGMTYAFGSIWIVGASRVDGEPQAILTRVDPSTNQVLATIDLGGRSGADVSSTSDAIWVATFADPVAQVVRVDPVTNQTTETIDLGSHYVRRLEAVDDAVVAEEMVWPSNDEGPCGILTSVDALTKQIRAREPLLPCGGGDLIAWQGRIWLSNDRFAPVDPHTARPSETRLVYAEMRSPRGFIVPDESGIWFAAYPGPGGNGSGPDVLTRLDASTGSIHPYFELPSGPIAGVALAGVLWILNYEGSVTRIDLLAPEEASIVPGKIALPGDAIPEGALLLQTGDGAEIVRSGEVMSSAAPGVGFPLDLSPDGSMVLGSTDAGLVAFDINTGEVRFLVATEAGTLFGSARWSPDGSMVAYTEGAEDPVGRSTICVLRVASLEHRCLPELGRVYSFDWAPNGEQVVVAGLPADPLTIVNVTTGALDDITPQEGDTAINDAIREAGFGTSFQLVSPTWSPSGSYLAALANLQDSDYLYVPVVFTPDGQFVAFGRPSGEYPEPMEWSPTRDVLAYTRGEAPYRITEAYLLDPATGEEGVLVSGEGSNPFVLLDMVWSPSGRWLAVAAWEAEDVPQMSLVVLDALDPTSLRRSPLDTGGISQFLGGWGP